MGSGKTTVGRIVADALGCPFLDLDDVVAARENLTIADIFATKGEEYFRRSEEQALSAVLKKYTQGNLVLALGGGTILSASSRALLQRSTLCIWLNAPAEVLWSRISGDSSTSLGMTGENTLGMTDATATRPLADTDFATRLESRRPLYAEAAHVTIDTEGLSPQDIADEIIISCL